MRNIERSFSEGSSKEKTSRQNEQVQFVALNFERRSPERAGYALSKPLLSLS